MRVCISYDPLAEGSEVHNASAVLGPVLILADAAAAVPGTVKGYVRPLLELRRFSDDGKLGRRL